MKKVIEVTFSDGQVWQVSAECVAKNRAKYYANKESTSKQEFEARYKEEYDYTMDDTFSLIDWAENNMNWTDMAEFKRVRSIECDRTYEWPNAKKEIKIVDE